jgi:hypothetical protein
MRGPWRKPWGASFETALRAHLISRARIRRRSRKIPWPKPLMGCPDYQPCCRGMAATVSFTAIFVGIIIKYLFKSIYYDKHPGESLIIDGLLKEVDRVLKIQSGVSFSAKDFLLLSDRIMWFNMFQKKYYGIILLLVILDQKN